jgi:hypothetical protein
MKIRHAFMTIRFMAPLVAMMVLQADAHAQSKPLPQRTVTIKRATTQVVPNNPEYLSGEGSFSIAANSNPLLRIGMAQNGVTLIEFPASDKFFAVHAGNSDLVTVEKSPSLKRDHHLVLRAGSGFLVPHKSASSPSGRPGHNNHRADG